MQSLRAQLIESGWRDEMKEIARESIRNHGLSRVTVDEIVSEILPRGKSSVPENVKADLLEGVRNFMKKDKAMANNSEMDREYRKTISSQNFGRIPEI